MSLFSNLMLLWKNRKTIKAASGVVSSIKEAQMKPGIKSSEFWGKTVIQVLTILSTLKPEIGVKPEEGILIVTGLEAIYGLYRSLVKIFAKKTTEPPTGSPPLLPPNPPVQ